MEQEIDSLIGRSASQPGVGGVLTNKTVSCISVHKYKQINMIPLDLALSFLGGAKKTSNCFRPVPRFF
jgi:hypothetical protein